MMDDTVADRDAELAMLMAMTGATVKQASDALDESGGDVDAATTYLNKGDLEKAATISKKMQSTSMKARSRHRREDVVDEDSAAKPNVVPRSTSPNTKATRAHQESLRYSPGRVSRATKKEYTHYKTAGGDKRGDTAAVGQIDYMPSREEDQSPPSSLLMAASTSQHAQSAGGRVWTPMPPRTTIYPGAVPVGSDGDDYTCSYSYTEPVPSDNMEPVVAEVVSHSGSELHALQDQIRQQGERLERILVADRNNAPFAQVITHEGGSHGGNNEGADDPKRSRHNYSKVRWVIVIGILLVAVATVVGVTLSRVLAPEQEDTASGPPVESAPRATPPPQFSPTAVPPTAYPTVNPTAKPTPASQVMVLTQLLSSKSFDGGAALQTPSTPQNKALNWLAENAALSSYSDQKKIQRYVLATLYYSTNGENWVNKFGWLSDSDECNWYNDAEGPFCVGGFVGELDLHGPNGLAGTIPPELALLSNSVYNSLTGTIPSEIALLKNVVELELENNNLWGSIPTEIASMGNLEELFLFNNVFTGNYKCPNFIGTCLISCDDTEKDECRSRA